MQSNTARVCCISNLQSSRMVLHNCFRNSLSYCKICCNLQQDFILGLNRPSHSHPEGSFCSLATMVTRMNYVEVLNCCKVFS